MFVFFQSRGLEFLDIARIVEYRLRSPPRTLRHFMGQMGRINHAQARNGYPQLCDDRVADWDTAAVDDFIIYSTNDTHLLEYLLRFDNQHICFLQTVGLTSYVLLATPIC